MHTVQDSINHVCPMGIATYLEGYPSVVLCLLDIFDLGCEVNVARNIMTAYLIPNSCWSTKLELNYKIQKYKPDPKCAKLRNSCFQAQFRAAWKLWNIQYIHMLNVTSYLNGRAQFFQAACLKDESWSPFIVYRVSLLKLSQVCSSQGLLNDIKISNIIINFCYLQKRRSVWGLLKLSYNAAIKLQGCSNFATFFSFIKEIKYPSTLIGLLT